jgi:hypothetical protein
MIYECYYVPVTVSCISDSISINCIPDVIVVSRVSLIIASALIRVFLISGTQLVVSFISYQHVQCVLIRVTYGWNYSNILVVIQFTVTGIIIMLSYLLYNLVLLLLWLDNSIQVHYVPANTLCINCLVISIITIFLLASPIIY